MPSKSMNRIASPLMPHPVRYIAFEFDTALIAIGMSLSPVFIVERRSGGDCARRHSERLEVFRHAFQALSDHRTEAHPSRDVSVFQRVKACDERPLSLLAIIFERDRMHGRRWAWLPFLVLYGSPDEPFRFHALAKTQVVCELGAVGA